MIAGGLLSIIGSAWLILAFGSLQAGEAWGYDYRAYHDAAQRLDATGSLYRPETLSGPYRPGPFGLYMYAPPLGIATGFLVPMGTDQGATAWFAVHVAALALACALMPIRVPLRLATFGVAALSYAVMRDLALGNVSVLLLLPLVLAWRGLDRPVGSVALALAMSVRPTLGIVLVWQLLRRQWTAVAWTIAAGLALVALSLPWVGVSGYLEYLEVLRNLSDVTGVERNIDFGSTVMALGGDTGAAGVLLMAGYAVAIGAILVSLRRDREVGFMVTVTASLMLSPLLWDHYLSLLVLPAAFLAQRGRPWALALPLLSWLPAVLQPFVVLLALGLPFLAREADAQSGDRPMVAPSLAPDRAPARA